MPFTVVSWKKVICLTEYLVCVFFLEKMIHICIIVQYKIWLRVEYSIGKFHFYQIWKRGRSVMVIVKNRSEIDNVINIIFSLKIGSGRWEGDSTTHSLHACVNWHLLVLGCTTPGVRSLKNLKIYFSVIYWGCASLKKSILHLHYFSILDYTVWRTTSRALVVRWLSFCRHCS